MKFSQRTNWIQTYNRLTKLLEERRASGKPIFDLTISNPTDCGIDYPTEEILASFADQRLIHYDPDPHGLLSARETIASYYLEKRLRVDPSQIFLTASTSEAYGHMFKILCDVGDAVLVPRPSYPLYEYLAQLHDVGIQQYQLFYDHGWHLDIDSLQKSITSSTKAIVLINPHNPTGMVLKEHEYANIVELATKHDVAILVDEVFIDYQFDNNQSYAQKINIGNEALTFTLNGISKLAGLPQMKLGWIVVTGKKNLREESIARLETVSDMFLSVNMPVQIALPKLMRAGSNIREILYQRIKSNYDTLSSLTKHASSCSFLKFEAGWYGILRLPRVKSDEEWAIELLQNKGICVFPGYFFDFNESGNIVISLIVEEAIFQRTMKELLLFVECSS